MRPPRFGRLAVGLAAVLAVGGCAAPVPAPTTAPTASASVVPTTSASAIGSASALPAASASAASIASASASSRGFAHVYLIVMENHEYDAIVGSSEAPYLNSLIAQYGLVTGMHAETHPSEPNYLALVSGGTQGVHDDGAYNLDAPNLFDQVEAAGRTWHVYAQGYPGDCSGTTSTGDVADGPGVAGDYARKHNPAISFTSISRNPGRCARITGLSSFDPAAADLELIIPNQRNDMHSASIRTGDDFLRAFLPSVLGSAAFAAGSLLVITWDEGDTNDGGGGHIATIVATPGMARGSHFDGATTHYSILRAVEDAWGMPHLGGAADAVPLGVPVP